MFKIIFWEGRTSKKIVNACHAKHPENFQETVLKTYCQVQKHSFYHQVCLSCNNKDKIANFLGGYPYKKYPGFFTPSYHYPLSSNHPQF